MVGRGKSLPERLRHFLAIARSENMTKDLIQIRCDRGASIALQLDGSGYPFGLAADALDLPSRILVVCDIYDALTSDRPYRAGMSYTKATAIMESERGTRLCARALDALAAVRGNANPSSVHVSNP